MDTKKCRRWETVVKVDFGTYVLSTAAFDGPAPPLSAFFGGMMIDRVSLVWEARLQKQVGDGEGPGLCDVLKVSLRRKG